MAALDSSLTLAGLIESATHDLRERFEDYRDDFGPTPDAPYLADVIHEVADGATPIYVGDVAMIAADDPSLLTDTPEEETGVTVARTAFEMLQFAIYARIEAALFEAFEEIREETDVR